MNHSATALSPFLWHYQLDGDGGGAETTVPRCFQRPEEAGFDWWHLESNNADTAEWLRSMDIDIKVIDALTADETRPRSVRLAGGTLVVLRGVNTNPGSDPEDMVSIRIWFTGHLVITTRKSGRKLLSVQDMRAAIDKGSGPCTTGDFISLLIERLADRISHVVDDIEQRLEDFEEHLNNLQISTVRMSLLNTRRQTAVIRRYLSPQREAIGLLIQKNDIFSEQDVHFLHLQNDRMTRYIENLDLARERALVLQGELQNQLAEQQNQRMYVLSVVAAIFLPLSFLTGVFGMNVAGLPGTDSPHAFVLLTLFMTTIAVLLIGYMWWKKWL